MKKINISFSSVIHGIKENLSLILIFVFIIALFYSISSRVSGFGIFCITVAIILFSCALNKGILQIFGDGTGFLLKWVSKPGVIEKLIQLQRIIELIKIFNLSVGNLEERLSEMTPVQKDDIKKKCEKLLSAINIATKESSTKPSIGTLQLSKKNNQDDDHIKTDDNKPRNEPKL